MDEKKKDAAGASSRLMRLAYDLRDLLRNIRGGTKGLPLFMGTSVVVAAGQAGTITINALEDCVIDSIAFSPMGNGTQSGPTRVQIGNDVIYDTQGQPPIDFGGNFNLTPDSFWGYRRSIPFPRGTTCTVYYKNNAGVSTTCSVYIQAYRER